jgi:hypothetical protein
VLDGKIFSDWGWRRNDEHDEKAREIFEFVIHVSFENNIMMYRKTPIKVQKVAYKTEYDADIAFNF